MDLTRRDFVKATSAVATAMGLGASGLLRTRQALGLESAQGGLPVVWLQGQACTGCSTSLLNSMYYATIDSLLLNTLDLNYHPNVMAAAGSLAVSAVEASYTQGGYVLVVEGAVPTASSGRYCYVWSGMTMLNAVTRYASKAAAVVAVGTCASYGGMAAGKPNPTGAQSVQSVLTGKNVINLPGCPMHPDWLVGTIAYILANNKVPTLDSNGRPTTFYGKFLHDQCPYLTEYNSKYGRQTHNGGRACLTCHTNTDSRVPTPRQLSQQSCLFAMGCKGKTTHCDCAVRKWNTGAANTPGYNWCVDAGGPCIGCTEPTFPDAMSPFYTLNGPGAQDD